MYHHLRFGACRGYAALAALLLAACGDYGADDPVGTGGAGAGPSTGGAGASGSPGGAGGGGATGGQPATGGADTGTGGIVPSCTDVVACGGDVVGTWTVAGACLTVKGERAVSALGLGCATARISGTLAVTGTWTAHVDGTFADGLVWTGQEEISLAPSCLDVPENSTCDQLAVPLQRFGELQGRTYSSMSCRSNNSAGGCTCSAEFAQVPSVATGTYTVAEQRVTTSGGMEFTYCATDATLTLTPLQWGVATTAIATGTVALVE